MTDQSIRSAVAERRGNGGPGTAVARPAGPDPAWQVLQRMEPEIAKVLPDHLPLRSYMRTALTGMRGSEALAELAATPPGRRSLYVALLDCARCGLMPFTDEAAIIAFGGKNPSAAFVPQYKGLMKGMINTGRVEGVEARLIHKGDRWGLTYGDGGRFWHEPLLVDGDGNPVSDEERGAPIFSYAYARLRGGGRSSVVILSRQQAIDIRDNFSRSYAAAQAKIAEYEAEGWSTARLIEGSVWHRDFNGKWIISAIRRIKDVPRSADLTWLLMAAARDDVQAPAAAAAPTLSDFGIDDEVVDAEIVEEGALAAPVRGPESHGERTGGRGDTPTRTAPRAAASRQERASQGAK